MSIGAPFGARRSRALADDTFPIAGQDRIFDIAFDATFIAAQPIGGDARPRADNCLLRVLNYFFCSSFFGSSFFGSAPDGDVADDEDFDSLDDGGVAGVALDDEVSDELDEDDGVDGEGCDDDDDDDDGGVIGAVD